MRWKGLAAADHVAPSLVGLARDPHLGELASAIEAREIRVRDQDAVISTLGVGRSFKSGALIAQSMSHIVRAMEGEGVR